MKNLNKIKTNAANSGSSEAMAVLDHIDSLGQSGADDDLMQTSLLELASWALAFHDSIDQSKCGLTSLVLDDGRGGLPLILAVLDQMTDDMGLERDERAFLTSIESQLKSNLLHDDDGEVNADLEPGNYSIFCLNEDNTFVQRTYKITEPMSEHDFRMNAETLTGAFISFGVNTDPR